MIVVVSVGKGQGIHLVSLDKPFGLPWPHFPHLNDKVYHIGLF